MKRSEFIQQLGTFGILSWLPITSTKQKTYAFGELFYISDNDANLIYPQPDSVFHQDLLNELGCRFIPGREFSYYEIHDVRIPCKHVYTLDDLIPINLYFRYASTTREYTCDGTSLAFRMIRRHEDHMHLAVFVHEFN